MRLLSSIKIGSGYDPCQFLHSGLPNQGLEPTRNWSRGVVVQSQAGRAADYRSYNSINTHTMNKTPEQTARDSIDAMPDIRQGKTIRRNPTLTEHASHILPYRGMGSGIPRALEAWPQIDLVDDPAGNQFSAVIWRAEAEWSVDTAAPQVTGEVAGEVIRLTQATRGEMKRTDLQRVLNLRHEDHFRKAYLKPALEYGVIEMTIPDRPRSSKQRYRLTDKGRLLLKEHNRKYGGES